MSPLAALSNAWQVTMLLLLLLLVASALPKICAADLSEIPSPFEAREFTAP